MTLKLNAKTGVFTGSFLLEDTVSANPGKPLRRKVPYQGCLIPESEGGVGYYLLPELPEGSNTIKTSPIRTGFLELKAVVE